MAFSLHRLGTRTQSGVRGVLNFFGFLFAWGALGVLMAAAVLAGMFWHYGRELPDTRALSQYEPATLSRIYSARGLIMDEFARERRIFTPIDEIPPLVVGAFLSAEDKGFYQHPGFSVRGIAAALVDAAQGRRLRGASTITQQVMKNFLLDGDRTAERKVKELILAVRAEAALTKDQILELYLNEIFLGQNAYGVTAAAQIYFAKSLEDLTPAEAAYLAAIPRAPSNYHPVRERQAALDRRNYVLREMWQNGYLPEDEYRAARASDLVTVQSGEIPSARAEMPPRDYFTDEIRRQLSDRLPGGEEQLFTGGLTIRATVEPGLQAAAAQALRNRLEEYDRAQGVYRGPLAELDPAALADGGWRAALDDTRVPRDIPGWIPAVVLQTSGDTATIGVEGVEGTHDLPLSGAGWIARVRYQDRPAGRPREAADLWRPGDVILVQAAVEGPPPTDWSLRQIPELQGAFMAMDVTNGRVLAMQGGFSYQHSVFNRATQATRQPGSAFKPFVYAAALDSGYTPATIVIDAPIEVDTGNDIWRPTNASNRFYGPTPLRTGIERSRNLMTVRVAQDIGMDRVSAYAERFGVYEDMPGYLSYALGAGETTLFDMVAAYSMFANGGQRVRPALVDRVQDRYGETIYRHDQRGCRGCRGPEAEPGDLPWIWNPAEQVMDPVTAWQLTSMMQGVVSRGTAASTVGQLGVPIAGKTGTTNDSKDAWFIGFTPQIAAGCYIGFDQPRSMGAGAYGGTLCAPVFTEFMETALEDHGSFRRPQPPGTVFVKIDRATGQRLPDGASGPDVVSELFRAGEEPPIGGFGTTVDGGFAMAEDLPLFSRESGGTQASEVTGEDGERRVLRTNPSFGELSSGGLY